MSTASVNFEAESHCSGNKFSLTSNLRGESREVAYPTNIFGYVDTVTLSSRFDAYQPLVQGLSTETAR